MKKFEQNDTAFTPPANIQKQSESKLKRLRVRKSSLRAVCCIRKTPQNRQKRICGASLAYMKSARLIIFPVQLHPGIRSTSDD